MERDFKGVWIPKQIWLNEELNWTEKLLLVEIDSLAKNGECFASNEHFAKFLKVSIRQVQNSLATLKEKAYISTFVIYREGTKQVEKRIITPHEENYMTPCKEVRDPHEKNCTTPHEKNCMDNNTLVINTINNTKSKNYSPSSPQIEKEFEKLWTIYPRKIGKKKAFDSYKKARKIKKMSYETIEKGLYRYITYLEQQGTDEQFIQHASTWFNQEKWLDDYVCTATQKKAKNSFELYQMEFGGNKNEPRGNAQVIDDYQGVIPELL